LVPIDEPSQGRRRGRLGAVAALAILVLVGVAVFALAQGGGGGGPLNAIAEAAAKTQEEPGGRAIMRTIVSSPERPDPIAITGHMVYDAEDRTRGVMTGPASGSDRPLTMYLVLDGYVMYLRSSKFGSLPDGATWMKLDLSSLEEPGSPVPVDSDPKGELALLEAVSDDVQKLGREDVRGVPTTRYRGTVDSEDAEEDSPLQLEVWIDGEGLVRRMRLVKSQPQDGGEEAETIDMRVDFYDFGIEPEIDVPNSSDVFDATELAQE
jgi:hypothetical protein